MTVLDHPCLFNRCSTPATNVGLAAAALFLAWAGFLYMTASGSPRRMESAKDAAFAAIGGLAVVLLAHTIAQLVSNAISLTVRRSVTLHAQPSRSPNAPERRGQGPVRADRSPVPVPAGRQLGRPTRCGTRPRARRRRCACALRRCCVAAHAGVCPGAPGRSTARGVAGRCARLRCIAAPCDLAASSSRSPPTGGRRAAAGRSWRRAWSGPKTRTSAVKRASVQTARLGIEAIQHERGGSFAGGEYRAVLGGEWHGAARSKTTCARRRCWPASARF